MPSVAPSPEPVVVFAEAEQPSPTRVVEQAPPREVRDVGNTFISGGSGNNSNGNGYGTGSHDNRNINGAKGVDGKKTGSGNNGNGNGKGNTGHANGKKGNGKPE